MANEAEWTRSATAISLSTVDFTLNNTPSVVQGDKTITVNPDAQDTPLDITAPTDINGDALTTTVTAIPTAGKGTVTKADGTVLAVNDVLTVAELTGLLFDTVVSATGSAGTFAYSVFDGTTTSTQVVTLAITEINDAPVNTVPGGPDRLRDGRCQPEWTRRRRF